MGEKHSLSKSTFIKGLQCHKALFLHKFHPELKDPVPPEQMARFRRGTDVGDMARLLFPGGKDAREGAGFQTSKGLENTARLLAEGCPVIYEAYFQHEGVLVILDILVRENEEWKAYEVKSSAEIKEVYRIDASLQFYVIRGSGIPLTDISVIHLDTSYTRLGELELHRLFRKASVLGYALKKQDLIRQEIRAQQEMLTLRRLPSIAIGPHCTDPYPCDFTGYCWQEVPEYSVFDIGSLSQDKKFELYTSGFMRMEEVPADFPLSGRQWDQIHCETGGEDIFDREAIASFLEGLNYPLYFVDFESFQPAVPLYDQSRPYQQIVFQYSSFYVEHPGGEAIHSEFLADGGQDPRPDFIRNFLQDTRGSGDILVYNLSFEKGRLQELAADFPGFAPDLEERVVRMKDLMLPFQKRWWYTPAMKGSFSIKSVYPALLPGKGWSGLRISDGGSASLAFEKMQSETVSWKVRKTRKELLEYCKLDTWAMVELLRALESRLEAG